MEKIVGIIQARMDSSRLQGKVLMPLNGKPVLGNIIDRAKCSLRLSDLVVATSIEKTDIPILEYCIQNNINCFRGSLNNVLERFYQCAKSYQADIIVRMTGDNVFIDREIIDAGIQCFLEQSPQYDYIKYKEKLPLGMAVEIFSFSSFVVILLSLISLFSSSTKFVFSILLPFLFLFYFLLLCKQGIVSKMAI